MQEKEFIEQEKERTMRLSIKEGSLSSVAGGFGDNYVTPFAIKALGATSLHIGILNALISLIPPIAQIHGSRLMEKANRKKIIVYFVTLQALMWIPILLLSLLMWKNIFVIYLPYILIGFYTIYGIFGAIAGPSWFSMMGDIVPEKIRGKYFGIRNKFTGTISLISLVIASFIIDYFTTKGLILLGFSILFFFACIFRLAASRLFKKHYVPELELKKDYYFSIWQFIKKAPSNNFGRFVIFVAIMYIAVGFGGTLYPVYLLKELNFPFITYMIANLLVSSIVSILFMPIWGNFSDKYGNKELIKIGAILISILPLSWLFSTSPYYLATIPAIINGIGWSAFNLGAGNFIYDSVTKQRRALCISYYNILSGVGLFIGALGVGILAQYITISFMNKFMFIFLIAGLARLAVCLFLPLIKEVRQVIKAHPGAYLREIKPFSSLAHEIIHDIKGIEKTVEKRKLNIEIGI